MTTLNAHFNHLLSPNPNWQGVKTFVDHLHVAITTSGEKVATVDNIDRIPLCDLVDKIYEAAKRAYQNQTLSLEDRVAGFDIIDKLSFFYDTSDVLISRASLCIYLISLVSSWFSYEDEQRATLESSMEELFTSFNREEFSRLFPHIRKRSVYLNSFKGRPEIYMVPRHVILFQAQDTKKVTAKP